MENTNKLITANTKTASIVKDVTFFIQGVHHPLAGEWTWDLQSDALFCSDVMMGWPADFIGTQAIFHPDDLPVVKEAMLQMTGDAPACISFRIITTYGEVKEIQGERVQPHSDTEPAVTVNYTAEAEKAATAAREFSRHLMQRTAVNYAERVLKSGICYTNYTTGETWVSDEWFRIIGLAPQSINIHANMLYAFLHPDDRKEVIDAMEESRRRLIPLHLEFRVVANGGAEKRVQRSTSFWYNEAGQLMMSGVLRDVTESHAAERLCEEYEATLSFQKQLLHFAESSAAVGYWQFNVVTKKIIYSDNFLRLFGIRPGGVAVTPSTLLNLVYPDDRELYEQVQARIRKEHTVPEVDYRIIRPDGKLRMIRHKGRAIISNGEMLIVGIIQDITVQRGLERKLAEQQGLINLKTAAGEQAEILAGTGSWLWNLKTQEIKWSDSFYELLGHKPSTLKPTLNIFLRSLYSEDQKLFNDELSLTVKEGTPRDFVFRLIRRGEVRHIKASFRRLTVDGEEYFNAVLQDVTLEQQATQSLTDRVRLLELLSDSIPEQVIVTDTDNNIRLWNRKAEEAYHRKREKTVGENLFDVLPELKQEAVVQRLNRVLAGEEVRISNEPGRLLANGFYNIAHIPVKDDGGAVSGIVHLLRDITAEHELNQQLTTRLHFIERLLEVSMDRVVALDRNMNYLYWNRRAEEVYGLTSEEVIGRNILEVFPQTQQLSYADFRRALRGETVHLPATEEQPEESYLIPVRDHLEEVTSVLWVQHDRHNDFVIRRQAQKALDVVNALNENYLELDNEFRVRFANGQALSYLSKTEEEITGKVLWDAFPEIIDTPLHIAFTYAMEERAVVRQEFASPLHGIDLMVSIAPTTDGMAVAFSDISFLKAAERQMAEEHRRLKEAQSIGVIGSFEWNYGDEFVEWSDEMYRVCNLEPQSERITIDRTEQMVLPEDLPRLMVLKAESFTTPGAYQLQHRILLGDDVVKWVTHRFESIADEAGNLVRIHGTMQDVTEQRATGERLADEHRRLKEAQALGRVGSFEWKVGEPKSNWSDELFRIHGLEPGEMETVMENVRNYIHPDDLRAVRTHIGLSLTTPGQYHEVHRIITKQGDTRWVNHQWETIGKEGNVVRVTGVVQDITEQKRTEEEIIRLKDELTQQTTDRYRNIINSLDEGFSTIDMVFNTEGECVDCRFTDVNAAFEKQAGLAVSVGQTMLDVLPGIEPFWLNFYCGVNRSGEPSRFEAYTKSLNKWFDIYAFPIDNPEDHRVAVVFNNITSRKKAEEQQAFLSEVSKDLVGLTNVEETMVAVGEKTGAFFGTSWCMFSEQIEEGELAVANYGWCGEGLASLSGTYRMRDFLSDEQLAKHNAGELTVVSDIHTEPTVNATTYGALGIRSFIIVPLARAGQWKFLLSIIHNEPRHWTEAEVLLVKELAERIWTRLERARAEERLHELNQSLEQVVGDRTAELTKSSESLQNKLAILQQTEDIAQIGSWEYEVESGRFTWSEGMYRLFGLPQGSAIKPEIYFDFVIEEDRAAARRLVKSIRKTYSPLTETLCIKREGQVRELRIKTTVVTNEKGGPHKVVGVDLDVTDLKEAEREAMVQSQFAQTIVDASIDQITIFGKDERFLVWNKAAEKAGGLKREDVIGKTITEVFPSLANEPEFLTAQQKALAGEMVYIPAKQGIYSTAYQEWFYVPLKNDKGETYAVLNIIHDISERIESQRLLQQQNRELEAKNEEITHFAFIASHDLKEPLRKIQTFSNWLMEKEANGLTVRGKEMVFKMHKAVLRLDTLITDITELTRLEAVKQATETVVLEAVLRETLTELRNEIAVSSAVVESGALPVLKGHHKQLVLLFKNIISNGIKFQEPDVVPVVDIRVKQVANPHHLPIGDYYAISFSDNGIGFDPEYAERIFKVFQRLHGQADYAGTGIGLAICKKIMENHGGAVTAESLPGKGAAFHCFFPV